MASTSGAAARFVTMVFGVFIVLAGLVAWTLEDEYGAGDAPGGMFEERPDGTVIVWDVTPMESLDIEATDSGRWVVLERDPETNARTVVFTAASDDDAQRFVEQQATVVFSGTQAEVDEWLAQRDAEYENFWIPGLIIAVGAILIVVPILQAVRAGRPTDRADAPEETAST